MTYLVQTGKGTQAYTNRYIPFESLTRAQMHYFGLNTHSGYKKRLVQIAPDGTKVIIHRVIT